VNVVLQTTYDQRRTIQPRRDSNGVPRAAACP
jgi:hypothetical protein